MVPYIDIHTHRRISSRIDRADDTAVIEIRSLRLGADDAGIAAIRSPGLVEESGKYAVPMPLYSAGIHPWDVNALLDVEQEYEYIRKADIIAVGEIGLDYAGRAADRLGSEGRDKQKKVFAAQLEIAAERGLPAVIHCVKAFEDVMSLLKRFPSVKALFHGYTGSVEQTTQLTNSGYYISLGEVSLQSRRTIDSAKSIPPGRIFLETDDSDISIERIYDMASAELEMPLEKLKELIYNNFMMLFHI